MAVWCVGLHVNLIMRVLTAFKTRLCDCLGAFRTSPISSLHVEANEMPLELRPERLALNYMLQSRSNPSNPAYNCVFNPHFETLFVNKRHIIPTLGIRWKQLMTDAGINADHIAKLIPPATPLWLLKQCSFLYTLQDLGQNYDTPPYLFINKYNEIRNNLADHIAIFTDGSKLEQPRPLLHYQHHEPCVLAFLTTPTSSLPNLKLLISPWI
jgi:hypothetical protein